MDKVNCIVVGAGPAGSACAYSLSQKGIETVLIERGRSSGEKNVASSNGHTQEEVLVFPIVGGKGSIW